MPKMHRNPSVMKHSFSQVPSAEIPRSKFNRSHGHKTAFNSGYLVPFYVDEVMPGDTFSVNVTSFARLATPIFPLMDNMYMDTQFFFVPFRLIWDNWEKQQGAQVDPGDSTDFLEPQIVAPAGGHAPESIYDYMGIPPGVANLAHSALPLRAYALAWNQWYRDQNLQDSIPISKGDGPDLATAYTLLKRGKRHDYFTACLPWPQKGQAVQIPLGTVAPVVGTGGSPLFNLPGNTPATSNLNFVASDNVFARIQGGSGATASGIATWNTTALQADLTQATAATINSLRQAFAIQKMFERDARGGTRYIEVVQAHWKVKSPDARLQRVEFLGGGSTPIMINPVPQTSASGTYADSPQGNLAAYGTGLGTGHGFHMSFTEHGLVLGLVSIRADLTYQQGLERMWSRRTRVDRYWPALAHLGEQAVLRKEIYATGVQAEDETVFGYQERAGDYRYKPSRISGVFRSSHPQSLDAWHLSQEFGSAPVLGAQFIEENPPVDRVVAVTTEPQFICDFYIQAMCARPMPVFGVPGFIDRF